MNSSNNNIYIYDKIAEKYYKDYDKIIKLKEEENKKKYTYYTKRIKNFLKFNIIK
jgi:hypothetical protein